MFPLGKSIHLHHQARKVIQREEGNFHEGFDFEAGMMPNPHGMIADIHKEVKHLAGYIGQFGIHLSVYIMMQSVQKVAAFPKQLIQSIEDILIALPGTDNEVESIVALSCGGKDLL